MSTEKKHTPKTISKIIASLVKYAIEELDLDKYDAIFAHNALLDLFKIDVPEEPSKKEVNLQEDILDPLVSYGRQINLFNEYEDLLFETKIMGLVTPSANNVIGNFDAIASNEGIKEATDYLQNLCVKNNYIRLKDINKNIKWDAKGKYGDLIITINLSKPEKDNKQVALERSLPQTNYPKCVLCLENLGYAGSLQRAARQNLRVIPLFLNDESWFLQYSPFVYFDNHIIAVSDTHAPMVIDNKTFVRLLDFVENFPHFFIGSNADLPIVGGSILSHEHYQGGSKVLPMFTRKDRKIYKNENFNNVKISILDWYNTVIKLSSHNREDIEILANSILVAWRNYSDKSVEIIAKTSEQHNTITPICTWNSENGFEMYLILRNNKTNETHPYGIFHPTEDMHNIKKEGIGLIEAMGVFILPGRLQEEINMIVDLLTGKSKLDFTKITKEDHPLSKHIGIIAQLCNDLGCTLTQEEALKNVKLFINNICEKILVCTAVFKDDEQGQKALSKFLTSVSLIEA